MFLIPKGQVTKKTARNLEVRWIQMKVGATVDGIWGPKTAEAIIAYRENLKWTPTKGYTLTEKLLAKLKTVK